MSATKNWYAIANKTDECADVEIYDEIGGWGISAKEFCKDIKALEGRHINLRINSPGGSIIDGQAILSVLSRHAAGFTAWVEGLAASMASVIACAAAKTYIAEGAMLMIHRASICTAGDADMLRKDASLLEKFEAGLVKIYAKKTGMSFEEINKMLADETWMDAREAVAFGFADGITESPVAMASVTHADLRAKFDTLVSRMQHIPKNEDAPEVEQEVIESEVEQQEEKQEGEEELTVVETSEGTITPQEEAVASLTPEALVASIAALRAELAAEKANHVSALAEVNKTMADIASAHAREIEAKNSLIATLEKTAGLAGAKVVPVVAAVSNDQHLTLSIAAFRALTPSEKQAFFKSGGRLID